MDGKEPYRLAFDFDSRGFSINIGIKGIFPVVAEESADKGTFSFAFLFLIYYSFPVTNDLISRDWWKGTFSRENVTRKRPRHSSWIRPM